MAELAACGKQVPVNEDARGRGEAPLAFSVSQGPRGCVVVSVAGEIDAGNEDEFRDALTSALAGRVRLVVDLTRVTFMASAGTGVLMGVRRALAAGGGSLALASAHGEVAQVLAVAGVDKVIPVAASVADAAARLDS
jgi:anti-sigma B factor antagonist